MFGGDLLNEFDPIVQPMLLCQGLAALKLSQIQVHTDY